MNVTHFDFPTCTFKCQCKNTAVTFKIYPINHVFFPPLSVSVLFILCVCVCFFSSSGCLVFAGCGNQRVEGGEFKYSVFYVLLSVQASSFLKLYHQW